jgi:Fe-S cluster biogenesis protein NfuA
MIRSLVKQGIKRVLRMETRPAEYGGPAAYAPAPVPVRARAPVPEPAPEPVAVQPEPVAVEPEPAPAAKKPKKARAKKQKAPVLEATAPTEVSDPPPPALRATSPSVPTDDVAGPALDPGAVQVILDEMVRPALQGDGGDITLLRIENNDIYVKLVGSCSTCPSSILTMKAGVEALLKEEFPAMNQLIQVD